MSYVMPCFKTKASLLLVASFGPLSFVTWMLFEKLCMKTVVWHYDFVLESLQIFKVNLLSSLIWFYNPLTKWKVVYMICNTLNRQHATNHIIFVVSIDKGTLFVRSIFGMWNHLCQSRKVYNLWGAFLVLLHLYRSHFHIPPTLTIHVKNPIKFMRDLAFNIVVSWTKVIVYACIITKH